MLNLNEVATAILEAPSFSYAILLRKWRRLAKYLNLSEGGISELEERISNDDSYQAGGILRDILYDWEAENGEHATLGVVCDALDACHFDGVAELLKTRFGVPAKYLISERILTLAELFGDTDHAELKRVDNELAYPPYSQPVHLIKEHFYPPKVLKYVIPTRYAQGMEMDGNVIRECSTKDHVFVLRGHTLKNVSTLGVQPNQFRFSSSQLAKVTTQYIHLERDDHYERICEKTEKAVHLVHLRGRRKLIWIKCSQNVDEICDLIKDNFGEGELTLKIKNSGATCHALGIRKCSRKWKTFAFARIASKLQEFNPNAIVLLIPFEKFLRKIETSRIESSSEALDALSNYLSSFQMTKLILDQMLRSGLHQFYFLLDGYDEIAKEKMEVAESFLEQVKNLNNCNIKFIVATTTATEVMPDRTSKLDRIAEALPICQGNLVEFVIQYWSAEHGMRGNNLLKKFALECVKTLDINLKDGTEKIIDITLWCMTLAEIFAEEAEKVLTLNKLPESPLALAFPDVGMRHKRIVELVRQRKVKLDPFFDLCKTHIQFKLKANVPEDKIEIYWNAHVHASIALLFPEWINEFECLCLLDGYKDVDDDTLYSIGLVEKDAATDYIPILTEPFYAEFMIAEFMVKHLNFHEMFLKCLTGNRPGQKGCNKIGPAALIDPVIPYFINLLLQLPEKSKKNEPLLLENLKEIDDYLPAVISLATFCCIHELESFLNVILPYIRDGISRSKTFRQGRHNLLHYFTIPEVKNISLFKKLWRISQEFGRPQLRYNPRTFGKPCPGIPLTSLHYALGNDNCEIVLFMLEEYREGVLETNGLLHYCVLGSGNDTDSVIGYKLSIIDKLLQLNPNWLHEVFDELVPILRANIHAKLLQRLVEQHGADINTFLSSWGTILHRAADTGNSRNYENVVRYALNNGFNLVNQMDGYGQTPVMVAIITFGVLSDETLHLLFGAGADFNAKDEHGNTPLFHAIHYSKSVEFIQKILAYGGGLSINHQNKLGDNAAHQVINSTVKDDPKWAMSVLKLLEGKGFEGYKKKNSQNLTPFRMAWKLGISDAQLIHYLWEKEGADPGVNIDRKSIPSMEYDWMVYPYTTPLYLIKKQFYPMDFDKFISIPEKFVRRSELDTNENFGEEELVTRIVFGRAIIHALSFSDPWRNGNVSASTVHRLASRIKDSDPDGVVLILSFEDFMQQTQIHCPTILDAIAGFVSTRNVAKLIVSEILKKGSQQFCLFLDGYENIPEEKVELADKFLKQLSQSSTFNHVKVIVTANPENISRLENVLNQPSFETLPLSQSNLVDFVTQYWFGKYKLATNEILQKFAEEYVKIFDMRLDNQDEKELLLQCKIIAEILAEEAKTVTTTGTEWTLTQLDDLKISKEKSRCLFEMYRSLIDMKFRKIANDKRDSCLKRHYLCAATQLIPDWSDKFLFLVYGQNEVDEDTVLSIGLLGKRNQDADTFLKFKDPVLAKFFLAEFIVKNLADPNILSYLTGKSFSLAEWGDNCIDKVDLVLAYFVDMHLPTNSVVYNALLSNLWACKTRVVDLVGMTAICCIHELENCMKFFLRILRDINTVPEMKLKFRDKWSKILTFMAIPRSRNIPLLEKLLKFNLEFGIDLNYFRAEVGTVKMTPLHLALYYNNCETVLYLLMGYGKRLLHNRGLLHYCVRRSGDQSDFVIGLKLKIIETLVTRNPECLKECVNGFVPILLPNIHVKLLRRLVELGADVNTMSVKNGTVLHLAAWDGYGSQNNYKDILRWAVDNGFTGINFRHESGRTPLMEAIKELRTLDDEILQWFHEAVAEFNAVDKFGDSVLFYAIRFSKSEDFVRKMLEYADVHHLNLRRYNAAHAIIRSHVDNPKLALSLLKLVEEKGFRGFNGKDADNLTPYELAGKLGIVDVELMSFLKERTKTIDRCTIS